MVEENVTIAHGGGGSAMRELLERVLFPNLGCTTRETSEDAASLRIDGARIAFTTDSYVVDPVFFPGGDIGKLAVCGTVNDLAMRGANPLFISVSLILEEGFPTRSLERIAASIGQAANESGVQIVAGDTKVVNRGKADSIFVNTAGLGLIPEDVEIGISRAVEGDAIIINGYIGDHGIAILRGRENFPLEVGVISDCAPLNSLVEAMISAGEVHVLRDPTRGGLSAALNEMARGSSCCIVVDEACVPIREEVKGVCEVLGLDPYSVANEGKVLAAVKGSDAERVLGAMRKHRNGRHSSIIGRVEGGRPGTVVVRTSIGSKRLLKMPFGEQLPRIC